MFNPNNHAISSFRMKSFDPGGRLHSLITIAKIFIVFSLKVSLLNDAGAVANEFNGNASSLSGRRFGGDGYGDTAGRVFGYGAVVDDRSNGLGEDSVAISMNNKLHKFIDGLNYRSHLLPHTGIGSLRKSIHEPQLFLQSVSESRASRITSPSLSVPTSTQWYDNQKLTTDAAKLKSFNDKFVNISDNGITRFGNSDRTKKYSKDRSSSKRSLGTQEKTFSMLQYLAQLRNHPALDNSRSPSRYPSLFEKNALQENEGRTDVHEMNAHHLLRRAAGATKTNREQTTQTPQPSTAPKATTTIASNYLKLTASDGGSVAGDEENVVTIRATTRPKDILTAHTIRNIQSNSSSTTNDTDEEVESSVGCDNGMCNASRLPYNWTSDASWALGSIIFLMCVLTFFVLYTGLWKKRNSMGYPLDSSTMPNPNRKVNISELLKSKLAMIPKHLRANRYMHRKRRNGKRYEELPLNHPNGVSLDGEDDDFFEDDEEDLYLRDVHAV